MTILPHSAYIPLLDRGIFRFDRPAGDYEEWARALAPICAAVIRDYRKRQASLGGVRREGANDWLTRVAYDLLLPALEDDQREHFEEWNKRHSRYLRHDVQHQLNPFQVGLMALFAPDPQVLSRRTRHRIGKRLWHAARHYVPPPLVPGFIKQLESSGLEQRADEGRIEAGFEGWVAQRRVNAEGGMLERGIYPRPVALLVAEFERKSGLHVTDDDDIEDDDIQDNDYHDDHSYFDDNSDEAQC